MNTFAETELDGIRTSKSAMSNSRNKTIRERIARLQREEDGGAYTLSYVMIVPIVMLLVCLIVETTLMMSAKVGTVYAAYAGARVGSVWSSATSWTAAEEKINEAAVQAFVPFASAAKPERDSSAENIDVDALVRANAAFATKPVSDAYIKKKCRNAVGSIQVTTNGPPASWDSDIEVTIRYDCPFRIPGIGRIFGEESGDGYVFRLTSKATLQNEGPQNDSQGLGIGYGTLE